MRKIEEKGITLIALIITIVVLLILAVVAINAVTGDGIIQHATNAKTSYENAQAKENEVIGEYLNFLNKNNPNKPKVSFELIWYDMSTNPVTVREYKLEVEEGMTWKEYCDSVDNTIGLYYENEETYIFIGNDRQGIDLGNGTEEYVSKDDVIKNIKYYANLVIWG